LGIRVDVSKKADVDGAVAQVHKTYGRPADLIVNSAGIADVSDQFAAGKDSLIPSPYKRYKQVVAIHKSLQT